MDDLKLSINNLITQIEEKLSTYDKLTSESDKHTERHVIETLIAKMEDEYSIFEKQLNRAKIGKQAYTKDAEFYEEKMNSIKQVYEQLKNDSNKWYAQDIETVTTPGVGTPVTIKSHPLLQKFAIGESDINRGKEKLDNIRKGLLLINEEITSIEEEIESQREKLELVKNKVSDSHSIVKQSKKIMDNISKMLYHDTLLKILIVLISLTIVGIIVMAVVVKVRKFYLGGYYEDYSHIEKNIDYRDIDENLFMELYNTGNVNVFFNRINHL